MLHDVTGGWTLVLGLLALTSVPLTIAGVRVARPTYVDDEI
jgi:CP family cyanate transporter-like MFS transporter